MKCETSVLLSLSEERELAQALRFVILTLPPTDPRVETLENILRKLGITTY